MRRRRPTPPVALVLLALLATSGCRPEAEVKVIRLAHNLDPAHPVHQAAEFMAQRLAETSGGRLEMKVYPSGQLCSDRECLELLQLGSLDLAKVSTATMENFAPAFRVFGVPYLFRDDAHRFAALDGSAGWRTTTPVPAPSTPSSARPRRRPTSPGSRCA